ncbi:uncharacterized protein LOC129786236 [Lutzomyia longipalpis]|uniref:uncharacterized protein LOC129786236 n=1 Tax=Lutzomyia longipalpis TaxID=7200 RepID=UPI002483E262|nr:uncharacterized protein LOC129786236 [Lutzomyia longipalpis]
MKVLLSFVALFAFAAANSQFAGELRAFHRDFTDFHYDLNYFLRFQRLDSSEEIADFNRVSLDRAWDSVSSIKDSAQSARDAINQRAQEIGNQNPCLIALSERLQEREAEAGQSINRCAVLAESDYSAGLGTGYFGTINYAQRMASFTLLQTLYTIGTYNPVTWEDQIRFELQITWDYRESIRMADSLAYYLNEVRTGMNIANINFHNCVLTASSLFGGDATRIGNDAQSC